MKKYIGILAAACALVIVLGTAAAVSRNGEASNTVPAPSASAESTAGQLSGNTEKEPEPEKEPEEESPEAALTMEDIRAADFSDVPDGDARADYIRYAAFRGFMEADDTGKFAPEDFVTRGELMTALLRVSGQEAPDYDGKFSDISREDPCAGAVSWAVQAGIAAGTTEKTFSPQAAVSRQQLAVFLYRFAAQGEETAGDALSEYRDGNKAEAYARGPLAWALEKGLFAGMVSDTIYPALPVSRAQLAQVLVALTACDAQEPLAQALDGQLEAGQVESASRAHHEEIQKKINAIASKYGAMGLQAAVVENGEVTDAFAYGWAVKDTTAMTTDHKIRSASITKVAVGMAAMILREEGVVDLDESIGTYWGVAAKNPSHSDTPVSIRTLLSHTSSLKVFAWDVSRSREHVRDILQSGSSYMKSAPGSGGAWGYNNYGFGVLGQTLELASGKYLDEIMADRLWSVMGIDSAFESGSVRDTDRLATLYEAGKVYTSHKTLLKNVRPSSLGATGDNYSGGMTISAPDLAKMAALLVNDGQYEGLRLLSEESVALLESDSGVQISENVHQALPLRFRDGLYGRERLYYHTGSGYGVYNLLSYDPEAGDAVVVLTTGASGVKDGNDIYAICGEITEYIYDIIQ